MPEVENVTPYPVTTWKSYRQDLTKMDLPVRWASDLVSKLHDYINSYHDEFRALSHMRQVFESTIRQNTAEDEPDAPWIEVTNEVDADPAPPWEFYYSNHMWLGDGIDPPDVTKLVGCDCKGKCDPKSETCSCLKRQAPYYSDQDTEIFPPGFAYDSKGRLRTITSAAPVFECNALCSCDDEECMNRVVQHGRRVSVALRKTENKGWGVFATKKILKGTFVGVYAGEFLRDDECERRGLVYDKSGRTYLLDIDFYYLQQARENPESSLECQYVVDAYHVGNFTRFLNNSCDPNCRVIPCYINEPDINKPLMTMFTRIDVAAGEELCFSYYGIDPDNPDEEQVERTGRDGIKNECRCGAKNCVR
ncbi:hypothetical protein FB45DRAFT_754091 [Roridomyces roridus]|uniref:SET domain-containing protein n=1 Tax=Roridomyces roridus TaxID=1738132 RepID=A0AAD7BHG8_9AGAR|nr:hypothetical protein FB45DRAFT_754091 [Roridomyces roridus]